MGKNPLRNRVVDLKSVNDRRMTVTDTEGVTLNGDSTGSLEVVAFDDLDDAHLESWYSLRAANPRPDNPYFHPGSRAQRRTRECRLSSWSNVTPKVCAPFLPGIGTPGRFGRSASPCPTSRLDHRRR